MANGNETILYPPPKKIEKGTTGGQLSRGFDLNFGRDEMTSGGAEEHRVDVLKGESEEHGTGSRRLYSTLMDSIMVLPLMPVGALVWRVC